MDNVEYRHRFPRSGLRDRGLLSSAELSDGRQESTHSGPFNANAFAPRRTADESPADPPLEPLP